VRLALGGAQFGMSYGISNKVGQVSSDEVRSILNLAESNRLEVIDTAIAYGESEACLGSLGVKNFKVITKLPAIPDGIANVGLWVRDLVEGSLSRLQVPSIDGLLLHRSEDLLSSEGSVLYDEMAFLKESGLIKKFGISIYSPDELSLLMPRFNFDIVQAPFNLIDRRLYQSGWLFKLKDAGIEVHTRSTFLQGLLLMQENSIPIKFLRWKILWKSWHEWLRDSKFSALQASLGYPLSFPEIDQVIVGCDGCNQLQEILNAEHRLCPWELPNLTCEDEDLINPSNWYKL